MGIPDPFDTRRDLIQISCCLRGPPIDANSSPRLHSEAGVWTELLQPAPFLPAERLVAGYWERKGAHLVNCTHGHPSKHPAKHPAKNPAKHQASTKNCCFWAEDWHRTTTIYLTHIYLFDFRVSSQFPMKPGKAVYSRITNNSPAHAAMTITLLWRVNHFYRLVRLCSLYGVTSQKVSRCHTMFIMWCGVKFHRLPSVLAIGGLQQPVETVYVDEGSVFMDW